MKKRLASMALCLVLVLSLTAPAARAEEAVFFTAMDESILPLTDETMPFLSGTSIYIPTSIFTGAVRKALNVSSTYNKAQRVVILYRGSKSLWFHLDSDHAKDQEDDIYYPGAIVKGNEVFVSASLVARFFELTYSITEVPHGYMVWFRKADYPLSDKRFADAASYSMENRYAAYIKAKEEAAVRPPQQTEEPVMDGKPVYIALSATEYVERLLDTVENTGNQAAVFFTAEQMSQKGGVLRRMAVRGHSTGILLDAGAETDVLVQAEEANRALEEATCGRTRLVRVENPTDKALEALRNAGYCPVEFDMSGAAPRNAARAGELVQRISRRAGGVKVWLEDANTTGLSFLLRTVQEAEGRCRALTETA